MEAVTVSVTKDSIVGKTINEIQTRVDELCQFVESSAVDGKDLYGVERHVFDEVIKVGWRFVELFIQLQGNGDRGAAVTGDDGHSLVRSEMPHSRPLRTIFGDHNFKQFVYSAGTNRKIELKPLDARMGLSGSVHTYLMEEFSQLFCVESAFALSADNLGKVFGGTFSVNTLELTNARMGAQAEEFLDNIPKPNPKKEGEVLVCSADGKGVPMIRDETQKKPAMDASQGRPGNRKMATVAAVYSVDRHFRTAEDVVAALFRDDLPEKTVARPKPQFKHVTAHFAETLLEDGETFEMTGTIAAFGWILEEVEKRRKLGQPLLTLLDGDPKLWGILNEFLPDDTVKILDILHAAQYVWKAANVLFTTPEEVTDFARERLLWILQGRTRSVIRGLRHMVTARRLKGNARKIIDTVCNYFGNHLDHMQYDVFLREGYPIASGVIEGACRHLVKDRMERSGMRWTIKGATAMLNVRAVHQSSYWDTFHSTRRTKEQGELHPNRALLIHYHPSELAA